MSGSGWEEVHPRHHQVGKALWRHSLIRFIQYIFLILHVSRQIKHVCTTWWWWKKGKKLLTVDFVVLIQGLQSNVFFFKWRSNVILSLFSLSLNLSRFLKWKLLIYCFCSNAVQKDKNCILHKPLWWWWGGGGRIPNSASSRKILNILYIFVKHPNKITLVCMEFEQKPKILTSHNLQSGRFRFLVAMCVSQNLFLTLVTLYFSVILFLLNNSAFTVCRCKVSLCYKPISASDWRTYRPSSGQIQNLHPSGYSLLCLPINSFTASCSWHDWWTHNQK